MALFGQFKALGIACIGADRDLSSPRREKMYSETNVAHAKMGDELGTTEALPVRQGSIAKEGIGPG